MNLLRRLLNKVRPVTEKDLTVLKTKLAKMPTKSRVIPPSNAGKKYKCRSCGKKGHTAGNGKFHPRKKK